jgi:hypothetical protein
MDNLIKEPETIPISISKLKEYLNKEYKIHLKIDGNFILKVLDDKYDCHIYKKGKNKGTLKIYKTRDEDKNIKNNLLLKYNFEDKKINQENNKENIDLKKIKCNICLNNESKYLYENKKHEKILDSINNNYEFLYFDFYNLVFKYKTLCELSKTIIFNFKKINKIIINNNEIKKDYIDILIIINIMMKQEKAIDQFLLQ